MSESLPLAPGEEFDDEFMDEAEPGLSNEGRSSSSMSPRGGAVDVKNHRYPFCLVWGPLPLISWLLPWIGHLGIGDSEGKVHDFAGPYFIGIDDFMVPIFKYYQFPREVWAGKESQWNAGIQQSDAQYRKMMHNIFCNNCHHHSARALSNMQLGCSSLSRMDMLRAWWLITSRGRFVSWGAWLCTYMPLAVGVALVLFVALYAAK